MTSTQSTLDLQPRATASGSVPLTIQERFNEFHRANPQVYTKIVEIARELHGKGFRQLGIGMIYEVVRWNYMKEIGPIETVEKFSMSNDFRSRYARLIMQSEPDLKGVFSTRHLTA